MKPESPPGAPELADASYRMVAGVSFYGPCDFEKTDLFNHDNRADFRDRFGARIPGPDSNPWKTAARRLPTTDTKPSDHAWGGAAVTKLVNTPNSDIEDGKIKPGAPPAQLCDLEADRNQTTNLYNRFPEVVSEMEATLESCRQTTPLAPKKNSKRKK